MGVGRKDGMLWYKRMGGGSVEKREEREEKVGEEMGNGEWKEEGKGVGVKVGEEEEWKGRLEGRKEVGVVGMRDLVYKWEGGKMSVGRIEEGSVGVGELGEKKFGVGEEVDSLEWGK